MRLLALDIALLLPPDIRERAVRLSADLRTTNEDHLVLDADHHPHITLSQQFIRLEELDQVGDRIDELMRGRIPMELHVKGIEKSGHTVWMAVEQNQALAQLHEGVMDVMRGFERPGGGPAAFFNEEARVGDIVWVTGYRLKSSLASYRPHITLGHSDEPPSIDPLEFTADTVAACHLGRFCSCRRVLRSWELIV